MSAQDAQTGRSIDIEDGDLISDGPDNWRVNATDRPLVPNGKIAVKRYDGKRFHHDRDKSASASAACSCSVTDRVTAASRRMVMGDEGVHDYADITIHKTRNPGSNEIVDAVDDDDVGPDA